ncbi:MAG: hypothetical protein ACOCQ1_02380 [Halanaerobiaceae bacterium]
MENYQKLIKKYQETLLDCGHVVGVGYGPREINGKKQQEKTIVVLVDKKVSCEKLDRKDIVPEKLGSYRTDVLETGEFKFQGLRTEKMRPARPGISVGHYEISAGTLGAVVRDKKDGSKYILSNNHVLANISNGRDGRAEIGDKILQPAKYDQGKKEKDVLAYLERFIPIKADYQRSICPLARGVEKILNKLIQLFKPSYEFAVQKKKPLNTVDCAIARPLDEKKLKNDIIDIGQVTKTAAIKAGSKVKKSGRSTGLTNGEIRTIDTTVEVRMSETKSAVFEKQFITTPMSKAGDSGSLVVNTDNRAVGLLFAGSGQASVCNDIKNVLQALDIELSE